MHTAQGVSSQLLNRAVDLTVLTQLKQKADKWYARIDELSQLHGAFEVAKLLPAETNYLPTASSIALKTVIVNWHQYGANPFALNGATKLAANGAT